MQKLNIRPFETPDLSPLLACWEAASRIAHPFLSEEFISEELKNIPEVYMPVAETWVAEQDGRLAGFIALIDNEIGGLFVFPDCQRHGIGAALLGKAIDLRGELEVEVFEENPVGRSFYEKQGFQYIGESVFDRTGDKVRRMRRSL